jgi:hypothetical protein
MTPSEKEGGKEFVKPIAENNREKKGIKIVGNFAYNSCCMPSTPGDFPGLALLSAAVISSCVISVTPKTSECGRGIVAECSWSAVRTASVAAGEDLVSALEIPSQ